MEDFERLEEATSASCQFCGRIMDNSFSEDAMVVCNDCKLRISENIVPKKIKVFLTIICLCIVYSLIKLPVTISAISAYEKGMQFKQEKKQISAIFEFYKALESYPDAENVLDEIFESYYYDMRLNEAVGTFNKMIDLEKNPGLREWGRILASDEDNELRNSQIEKNNEIMEKIGAYYYPLDVFTDFEKTLENNPKKEHAKLYEEYIDKNPGDFVARYYLADMYFDNGEYEKAEFILKDTVDKNTEWKEGVQLLAATKREQGQYNEAVRYTNLLFENNIETMGGYIMLSKIELKFGNNGKGLEYALKANEYALYEEECYGILALAYHFNNDLEKRDDYLDKFNQLEWLDDYSRDFVNSIIVGKRNWRF